MKKIDFGQAVQIIANVGVIAGIVFLGIEISQNTHSLRSAAYQDLTDRIIEFMESPLNERGLYAASLTPEAFSELSSEEQRQMRQAARSQFRYGDLAFYQYESRVISEARFESLVFPLTAGLCRWFYVDIWEGGFEEQFVLEYRDYIDSKIAQC